MTDMESLDRAVEEARRKIAADMDGATVLALGSAGMRRLSVNVDALIAAVSAKARAEERERVDVLVWREHAPVTGTQHDPANGLIHGYCQRCRREWPCEWSPERARSSEEAGNGV